MKTQEWIQRIQKIIIFAKCMERKRETWGGYTQYLNILLVEY